MTLKPVPAVSRVIWPEMLINSNISESNVQLLVLVKRRSPRGSLPDGTQTLRPASTSSPIAFAAALNFIQYGARCRHVSRRQGDGGNRTGRPSLFARHLFLSRTCDELASSDSHRHLLSNLAAVVARFASNINALSWLLRIREEVALR